MFSKNSIFLYVTRYSIQSIPNAVNTMRTPTTTKRTIKAPVELIGSRVTTTTEKLGKYPMYTNICYIPHLT